MSENDKITFNERIAMVVIAKVAIEKFQTCVSGLNMFRDNYFRLNPDRAVETNLNEASEDAQRCIRAIEGLIEYYLTRLPSRRECDLFIELVHKGESVVLSLGMAHWDATRSNQIMQMIHDWNEKNSIVKNDD
jgi:hypothetical protein